MTRATTTRDYSSRVGVNALVACNVMVGATMAKDHYNKASVSALIAWGVIVDSSLQLMVAHNKW